MVLFVMVIFIVVIFVFVVSIIIIIINIIIIIIRKEVSKLSANPRHPQKKQNSPINRNLQI